MSLLLPFIFPLLFQGQGPLNLPVSETWKDSTDNHIQKLINHSEIEGISLALLKEDGEISTFSHGIKNKNEDSRIDKSTVFEAASLSKPVFSYLVLQLRNEGIIDLDRPLYQYLSNPDLQDEKRYEKITARMVLSHSTGLPNWRQNDNLYLQFSPGSSFSYSGEGFMYLQAVVEKLTGQELESLVQERVFNPLGMRSSTYVWADTLSPVLALGHDRQGKQRSKWTPETAWSAGSLHTTVIDYAIFLRALFNDQEMLNEMVTPQIALDGYAGPVEWGLGVGLQNKDDDLSFWHWGSNGGYKAFVIGYPASKKAMVYLTNSDNGLEVLGDLTCRFFDGPNYAFAYLKEAYRYPVEVECPNN